MVLTERNRIITEHIPLVRYLVNTMAGKLPSYISVEDLTSSAMIGLVTAVDRFNPKFGVLFKTFAEKHIMGSVYDELRKNDTLSRKMRAKYSELERQIEILEHALHRTPSDDEVADVMGLSLDGYYQLISNTNIITMLSIDNNDYDEEESDGTYVSEGVLNTQSSNSCPSTNLHNSEVAHIIIKYIEELPPRERILVILFFMEGFSLTDLATPMSMSKSRISQVITRALDKIKEEGDY